MGMASGSGGLRGKCGQDEESEVAKATIKGCRRKEKNKRAFKKLNASWCAVGKTAVLGIRGEGSQIHAAPVADTAALTLKSYIRANVAGDASVATDELYNRLGRRAERGVWEHIFAQLTGIEGVPAEFFIDSSCIKVHRTAGGAKGGGGGLVMVSASSKGAGTPSSTPSATRKAVHTSSC